MLTRGFRFTFIVLLVAGCSSGAPTYEARTVELTRAYHGAKAQGHAAESMTWFAKRPIHLASSDGHRGPAIRGLSLTVKEDNDAVKDGTNARASVGYSFYNGASHAGERQRMTFVGYGEGGVRIEEPILSLELPTWRCWYNKGLYARKSPRVEEKDKAVVNDLLREVVDVRVVFEPLSGPEACRGS